VRQADGIASCACRKPGFRRESTGACAVNVRQSERARWHHRCASVVTTRRSAPDALHKKTGLTGKVAGMLEVAGNGQDAMTATGSRTEQLLRRIRSEFHEMPGLCLTGAQAARLWNLDRATSEAALDALVADGYLSRTGDGRFVAAAWSTRSSTSRSPINN